MQILPSLSSLLLPFTLSYCISYLSIFLFHISIGTIFLPFSISIQLSFSPYYIFGDNLIPRPLSILCHELFCLAVLIYRSCCPNIPLLLATLYSLFTIWINHYYGSIHLLLNPLTIQYIITIIIIITRHNY